VRSPLCPRCPCEGETCTAARDQERYPHGTEEQYAQRTARRHPPQAANQACGDACSSGTYGAGGTTRTSFSAVHQATASGCARAAGDLSPGQANGTATAESYATPCREAYPSSARAAAAQDRTAARRS
jgi:hypothetical protein